MKDRFTWARRGGYECSSKGDHRFSAFFAYMPDGRSIEQHYQLDVKAYQPGGKGNPPLNKNIDLYQSYLRLWRIWAEQHPELISELYERAMQYDMCLSDRYATTEVNQAHALSDILNEKFLGS